MPGATKFERPIHRNRRLDAFDLQRESRTGLYDVELGGDLDRTAQIIGPASKLIGQREENPSNFLGFLLFERDDVVVDVDRGQRLEKEACAAGGGAVHDARNRRSMLRTDDEHVSTVAVGDHLLLQVFGRVAPPKKRFQRRPQLRPLTPQAFPDSRERRTRIVVDVARRIDLLADLSDFSLERGNALDQLPKNGEHRRRVADSGP
jgi:hypothetical protein